MWRARPLSPQHFLFSFVPRDKCFPKTSLWPPGMRPIKPNLSARQLCPSLFRAAPHTLDLTGSPFSISCRQRPYLQSRAAGNEIGCHKARLGRTSKEVGAVPKRQFRPRAAGGSLGFLGVQKVLGGAARDRRKEPLFILQKVVFRLSVCV